MPLQNRVDPFGEIHAVAARGLFTGNRGVIHDPATKTLLKRRWTTKAWIICACSFKGMRRDVMGRNAPSGRAGWTELFFLDEVTALAAGHRPCFYCRRDAARNFAQAFAAGLDLQSATAPQMDALLHRQRLAATGHAPDAAPSLATLPDGAMIAVNDAPFAIRSGTALPWRFSGYGAPLPLAELARETPVLLTPQATICALRAGYSPMWHSSADLP
ncbi:hypothetical protein [Mesorhizobium xinjiangense]|uniref:hypothetical protein n=1 Tax=Mesorhizobium xinjiangense TaxID=2678685 RepID=UPI0012ED0409|nr:hypothetical protein [Mesorhizobium xinjiangense]